MFKTLTPISNINVGSYLFAKRCILIILIVSLLCHISSPVLISYVKADTDNYNEQYMPLLPVGSEDEFQEIIENVLQEMGIHPSIGVSFCYTATGEHYDYNPDEWFDSASLFKLPMCMMLAKRQQEGEDFSECLNGTVNEAMFQALQYSNNAHAMNLFQYFFRDLQDFRVKEAELLNIDLQSLPEWFQNVQEHNAPLMMSILMELYYHQEDYPNIIDYLMGASPKEYLDNIDHDDYSYVIAQKYGALDYNHHVAGIIFTKTPILVVIETEWLSYPMVNKLMGTLSEAFIDYAKILDQRRLENVKQNVLLRCDDPCRISVSAK